jgi:hypothetical protein
MGCVRTVPSGDVTLNATFDVPIPPNVPTTARTRWTLPLTRSRSSTRSTIPAFGAGCDTSIQTSPRDAGPSIHGGAGMSVTTIVESVAHPVDAARGASASALAMSDSSVPSGRGWRRDTRSTSSPTLATSSAIVVSSRSNAESVKQAIADRCGAVTDRSATTAASSRVAPFSVVLMLADRSTSTRTPVLTDRSMPAAARQ